MFRTSDNFGKAKYSGRSKAVVIDNRDPDHSGKIQVRHPILGETVWIDYIKTANTFGVPAIGDFVYIECESGEQEFPMAHGAFDDGDFPDAFKRNVPTNRGLFSPGGHLIEIDDGKSKPTHSPIDTNLTTKSRGIRITSSSGHKIHISDDKDNAVESITILDNKGDGIVFDAKNKTVTLVSQGKMNISSVEDMTVSVPSAQELHEVKDFNVQASGIAQVQAADSATFSGDALTTLGNGGSLTNIEGSLVTIAGGGYGVARTFDRCFGIGNLGAPVSSLIIQGSTKVTSG